MPGILAAVDFSDVSAAAVAHAARLARTSGRKLWLLHVAAPDPDFVGYDAGPPSVRASRAEELRDERRLLGELAERLGEDIDVEPLLLEGPTIETILRKARELRVDLIAVGSHGHGALYQALLGSVSAGVIRDAKCPVLVVPAAAQNNPFMDT